MADDVVLLLAISFLVEKALIDPYNISTALHASC
jgi:hypothetical protein